MRHRTLLLAALIGASGLTACGGADPSNPGATSDVGVAAVDTKDRRISASRTARSTDGGAQDSTGTSSGAAGAAPGSTDAAPGPTAGGTAALVSAPPVGRLLASNCFACHGTNGRPAGGFDRLAGESASEIYDELKEMAGKTDEGIMGVHARGYSDTQLWQLATYFSQQR